RVLVRNPRGPVEVYLTRSQVGKDKGVRDSQYSSPLEASEPTAHYHNATKASRANGICMPLHKTPKPLGLASLFVWIAYLPNERHITSQRRSANGIVVDKDRVCAGHPDVHPVGVIDVHDVGSRYATTSLGDGLLAVVRFQADPLDEGAGIT